MKREVHCFITLILCVVIAVIGTGFTSEAKSCKHNFDNDICKKCGYIRVHEFDESILFYTYKDKVPIWSKPTKNSDLIKEISSKDTMINIYGVLRNQYGNIWLKVDKGYVYIDNVYLQFESLILTSLQRIYVASDESAILGFYDQVKPDGPADYKRWLDPSNKGISYKISIDGKMYDMTAEEIGNINYGFLGKLVGFSDDILLYAGGAVNQLEKFSPKRVGMTWNNAYKKALKDCEICDTFFCSMLEYVCATEYAPSYIINDIVSECSSSYCDTKEDAENVQRGIDYYNRGEFK